MTEQLNSKIIDRLRNLLALANHSRTPEAEANLAMERAQELMLKHNLTMATLEASGNKSETRTKDRSDLNLMFKWKQNLFKAIAEINFCHFRILYRSQARGENIAKGYEIIGRQSNVISARNMFEYLISTIERLVINEVGVNPQDRFNKYSHSFRLGCSQRLIERLKNRHRIRIEEQAREAREANARNRHPAAATANALVVVLEEYDQQERNLNNDLLNGWEPGTTSVRNKKYQAEWLKQQQEREIKIRELMITGISKDIAEYMAAGLSREMAERFCKPETKTQQRKRERREERENERWHRRYWREQDKIDTQGYQAGTHQAENVSLDEQVNRDNQLKIGE